MCNAHAKDYVIYDYINSIEHNECSFSDVAEHKIKIITSLTTFILTKVYFYSVLPWLVWSQCTHISANACYMDVSYLDEIDQLREMLSSHCWGCGEMLDATASSKLISDKSQIIIVIRLAAHAKPYPHFQWVILLLFLWFAIASQYLCTKNHKNKNMRYKMTERALQTSL